jgi:hypothetical protein
MGELPSGKDARGDQQHSFATLIHVDILALSCFVRLVIPSLWEDYRVEFYR